MDTMTTRIAQYAEHASFEQIPTSVVHDTKLRLLDTLGCILGAFDCDAAVIGRRLAASAEPEIHAGRIVGVPGRTTAETAAFVNTTMIRYLDFNDGHHAGHPSDMIGPVLALAESAGADGPRLLSSIVVAYDVTLRMIRATKLRELGWDQGFAAGIGTAASVGHLLRAPWERIGHGVSITAVGNVPMRASRAGQLSMWKGAATAYACRNAVFAALLGAEGVTSPDKPFEGRHGLFEQITGPFELEPFPDHEGEHFVGYSKMKYWPVDGNNLATVVAATELRSRMPVEQIAGIDIAVNWSAWHEVASEPEKWDPRTRETADHSMPYVFARTMTDGTITVGSFEPERYLDPAIRPLMQKITVHEDAEAEAIFHSTYPYTTYMKVTVTDTAGGVQVIEVKNPRGTPQNPLTEDEIRSKFHLLATPLLGEGRASEAADRWMSIDGADARGVVEAIAGLEVRR